MSRHDDNLVAGRRVDEWMRDAVAAAAATHPHPNPRVGAVVIATTGEVVGGAVHVAVGDEHAESRALAMAGERAVGGTLVVTLEPCSHHGLTPPCVDAVLSAGIARVIAGPEDPDERVAGRGFARLRAAGIEVIEGVAADAVLAADPGYFHHRRTGRPLVTLKYAMTADGQVAAADGTSRWITSPEARADAHRLRAEADAVMVGAGTLRTDDPRLTVRIDGFERDQPLPVVVAGRSPLPSRAAVYQRNPLIYRPERRGDEPDGAEVVEAWAPSGVDLPAAVKDLGARGIVDLLVEGGPTLARALLDADLVDRLVVYIGSKLGGGAGRAPVAGSFPTITAGRDVVLTDVVALGPDVRVRYRIGER